MERRKQKRVHFFAPATFGKVNETQTRYGVVMDVSYNGVFLMTNVPVDINDNIWVDFRVRGLPVKLMGRVMRKKIINNQALARYGKGGMGVHVEFMHPNILDYINSSLMDELKAEQLKKEST